MMQEVLKKESFVDVVPGKESQNAENIYSFTLKECYKTQNYGEDKFISLS